MRGIARLILALLAAALANVLVVGGSEFVIHSLFPTPLGSTAGDMTTFVARMPTTAKILVLAAWGLGSFAAASVALRVSGGVRWIAVAAIVLPLIGVIYSVLTIPHPLWMAAIGIALPPLAAFVALRTARIRAAA